MSLWSWLLNTAIFLNVWSRSALAGWTNDTWYYTLGSKCKSMDYAGFAVHPLDYCVNAESEDYHGIYSYTYECIESTPSSNSTDTDTDTDTDTVVYLNNSILYTFYWARDCIGDSAFNDTVNITGELITINCYEDTVCDVANETVLSRLESNPKGCYTSTSDANWLMVAHVTDYCLCQNVSIESDVHCHNFSVDEWGQNVTSDTNFFLYSFKFINITDSWFQLDFTYNASEWANVTINGSNATATATLNFSTINSKLPAMDIDSAVLICFNEVDEATDMVYHSDDDGNLSVAEMVDLYFSEYAKDDISCLGRVCDENGIYWVEYEDVNTSLPADEWCSMNGTYGGYDSETTVEAGCDKETKDFTIVECPGSEAPRRWGMTGILLAAGHLILVELLQCVWR